jgi:uncharacterized protein YjbI with pentapeptide repeats
MPAPEPIPDLLKAVNEASGKAFALWITFLTVGVYLAIAIGTTTHLQLLLAGPVKLPLLGVDMPLFAFYGFAPPMFVVLHLYVLMQLYLLARLLRRFDGQLQSARILGQDREAIRDQLDKFVFTQSMIGAPQDAIVRLLLLAVVWLSFVVGPVLLLLGFQLRFLPYHNIPVTYVHRVALLLDFVLLLLFWPKISRTSARQTKPAHNLRAFCRIGSPVLITVLLGGFSVFVATVPGEWLNQPQLRDWDWRMFSQNLALPGERLVEQDEDTLKKLAVTLRLSGRDLSQANFPSSDLRKSDLRYADLSGTNLSFANLSGANLSGANLRGAGMQMAELRDALLVGAHLNGAYLNGTVLRGAKLGEADLSGANLSAADLGDANLTSADLSGANLLRADLNGAGLSDAKLIGANLSSARLVGSNLHIAYLLAANLSGADLSGADLSGAHLSTAIFRDLIQRDVKPGDAKLTDDERWLLGVAKLIVSKLGDADLGGASLSAADLSEADLRDAKNLTQEQLDTACGTNAKLSPGLTLKPCPPK